MPSRKDECIATTGPPSQFSDDLRSTSGALGLLVESVTDYAIYVLDPEGRVVTWNRGAERSKGYRQEEVLGRNYSMFFLPEAVAAGLPAQELAAAARNGRFESQDWRLRRGGTRFWAHVTLTAIRANGELLGFAKVTRDMTAQKTAEEKLRRRNTELEHYRAVLNSVDNYAIVALDAAGRITDWGGGAERITGYTPAEALGREYAWVFSEEDRLAGCPKRELDAAEREGRCESENWRVRKDGSLLWAVGVLSAIRDEAGNLTGFIRIGRNMTEQKQAADSLKSLNAALERYRIIVENVADHVIFTLDGEGRINGWSPGARNILQYTAEEALGRAYSMVVPGTGADDEMRAEMEEASRSGHCATEGWRRRRDGTLFWASGVLSAIRDETGNLTGYIRVARDTTPQKAVEEAQAMMALDLDRRVKERTTQLEASVAELQAKNEEVEALVAMVSHDLSEKEVLLREVYHRVKNNLQVVQSLLKMGARTLRSADARNAIETAVQRVRAMAMVHEHLYQMPDLTSLTLSSYLRDVVEGAIASNSERPNQVQLLLDTEEIPVPLDLAIPLGLLTNELVSNCLKHGLPHGRRGKIHLSARTVSGAVRFVIQDDGMGLPEDFDASRCMSMGVKLAASLAHQLGGRLEFTSSNGCRVQADLARLCPQNDGPPGDAPASHPSSAALMEERLKRMGGTNAALVKRGDPSCFQS